MTAKADGYEENLLKLIFQNVVAGAIAAIGSGLQASSTAGSLYISLHTADPGEGGDQTTSECTYTGYEREAVARNATQWTVTNNKVENANAIQFKQNTGSQQTATHFGIGTAASGAGNLLYKGQITDPSGGLIIGTNVIPEIVALGLDTTED